MKKILLFAAVATMFAACTKDATKDLTPAKPTDTFYVSIGDDDSRVQLNDQMQTVWTEGDRVSVFNKTTGNRRYKFTGKTGDRTGELSYMNGGTTGDAIEQVVAVYPYNVSNSVASDGTITTTIPAQQTYCKYSFGVGSSIMVARSDDEKLSFRNVMGWIRIALTGEKTISRITLQGNNNELIAGNATINSDMSVTMASSATKTITLDCGDGVALSKEKPTYFYIAVPPQTFEKGISVCATDTDENMVQLRKSGAITVARNHIVPMASFDCTIAEGVSACQIAYTTSGNEPITPQSYTGNIVSHIFESGRGVITFDSEQTEIGDSAFRDCTGLTSVTIPDSVMTIDGYAFSGCSGLTSITIPDSVTKIYWNAFDGCTGLTSVTIPDSVTSIGESAFEDCTSLTSVTIPKGVRAISAYAFKGCTGLTSVTISKGVWAIGDSAFEDCTGLTNITIPDSVTKISNSVFKGCTGLTSITIPDSVTAIGNDAFIGCKGLKEVYITDIAAWCNIKLGNRWSIPLRYAHNLYLNGELVTDLIIPDSITAINYYAFNGCTNLTSVTIGNSVTIIGEYAFSGCTNLTSVTIGNSVTTIGDNAFKDCTGLTSITIPDGVTSINEGVFYNCASLTSITIPDSVMTIGNDVFCFCKGLTSVTIGNSVTTIGEYAFFSCSGLTSIYCKPTTPPTFGSNTFYWIASAAKIYVPRASFSAYKSNWGKYALMIIEYDF